MNYLFYFLFTFRFLNLHYPTFPASEVEFKISFLHALHANDLSDDTVESFRRCQSQLELTNPNGLIELLKNISSALNNTEFMQQTKSSIMVGMLWLYKNYCSCVINYMLHKAIRCYICPVSTIFTMECLS